MEREATDVNVEMLSDDDIHEMEERRIDKLNEAGVDEEYILERANKNLNTWGSYFNENIVRGKDDMNFVLRDQWTAVERSEFTRLFKPAMTFNKLYDATKKVIGEQRKNKPDLIVRSLTGRATQEQINLRADLVRTISYQSQNDLIYQTAFKSALMMGYGAFQVCVDYETPRSFNKVIRYDLVTDATMCSWDPTALKPHKGDGNFCSRRFIMTRDEFFATYPYVTNPVSFIDSYQLLDFQWQTRNTIAICDEYVKEWFPVIIYKVKMGDNYVIVDEDQYDELMENYKFKMEIAGESEAKKILEKEKPQKVAERQTQDYRIMHYRMIRDRIIDFSEWPSRQLPIPFVDGDSYYIEGRQYTKSFIHEARDAQKLHNYSKSELAAELKNRRREQWLGTPDNILGYEQDWRNPELQMGILRAKPDPKTGMMPQKMPAWEVSQGLFTTGQATDQDIREILGFSENEQLQGKDVSGKARRERKLEGSMSAFVFFDNLNQAVEQGGRIVNDLLDYVIGDEERDMVISKKDGKSESMIINQKMRDGTIKNRLEMGEFDVEIDTGPSFAVQKDIALEFLQQTLQAFPQGFPLIADLWAKNLDVQFGPQISERFKSIVPPEVLAKEEGKPLPPPKPNPEQMMMQAQIQEKQSAIQIKQQELELKKEQFELDKAKLMVETEKMKADHQLNIFDHNADIKEAEIRHNLDHRKAEYDLTGKLAGIMTDLHKHERQHAHEKEMAKTRPTG
jgi:portal protein